jgi:uridine phosphorylase
MKGCGKRDLEERFSAKMFVDYLAAQSGRGISDFGVKPVVVVSWSRRVADSFAKSIRAQLSRDWIYGDQYPLYMGKVGGVAVSIAHLPVGAAGTVMVMEEMIACGGRAFFGLGTAGSLRPEAKIGAFLIPTSCVSEEGTSAHYIKDANTLRPSQRLLTALESAAKNLDTNVITGAIWTTDAPYREHSSKIEAYRKQGVVGVDMETSAMYALGQVRGVDVCNLLVVSDELWKAWKPAFASTQLRRAMDRAQRVTKYCIEQSLTAK